MSLQVYPYYVHPFLPHPTTGHKNIQLLAARTPSLINGSISTSFLIRYIFFCSSGTPEKFLKLIIKNKRKKKLEKAIDLMNINIRPQTISTPDHK